MADFEFIDDNASTPALPITSVCIVADKNKAPKGFVPIVKCRDDQSEADLWRDSFFTMSRQVRYICVSTEIPESTIKAPIHVVTNMIIVRENDPIPHGYVAIDYTADSREKSLRKKYICIRTEPRDRVVDAIGEIVIFAKNKKVPRNYTSAGEVDQLLICFRVITIPQTYGIPRSNSSSNLETPKTGLYPGLSPQPQSTPNLDGTGNTSNNAFTMRNSGMPRIKAIDGIEFKVNPRFVNSETKSNELPDLSNYVDISRITSDEFDYNFATERAILS
ncbi:unnamed protein product [Caenorhabditis bovis]|uniref:Multivesicular body subunit 12A n=1 Tax=Caenorhabditis bovis TaxID=2654633 RepID=A0A8S1EWP3_9PELO|nr:unnamed protein product [Caenorhabditis bovis]